ncbi:MAG: UDP-N-acetylmuramoyl-L-alanyl-D-glutamate--2,6-diaminopimelate ligase, partial [Clostridiales bacterium]|nr:UDP-N-acetylmuramoyl-L-alanyl-D-glutamate--2,6-diaminopimelate ligase [Clostridiales bacterium]
MNISGLIKDFGELALDKKIRTDSEIKGIAYDSRKVKDGFAFTAAKGAVTDGHDYIDGAVSNGASAIFCDSREAYEIYSEKYKDVNFILTENSRKALALISAEFFGRPADKMTLIGITGTKGKTSTSFMVSHILEKAGIPCAIIGTTGIYYAGKYE